MADGRRIHNGGTISSHGNTCISETTGVMIEVFSVANRLAPKRFINGNYVCMKTRANTGVSEKITWRAKIHIVPHCRRKKRDSWYNVVWLLSHPSLPEYVSFLAKQNHYDFATLWG